MKWESLKSNFSAVITACVLTSLVTLVLSKSAFTQTKKQPLQIMPNAARPLSPAALKTLEQQLKDYVTLRERLKGKVPKISKESTPEEIEAHQEAFAKLLQAERATAKPGDIFTKEVAQYLRYIINHELTPAQHKEIKESLLHADNKGIALRINYPYPETKEMVEMLPTILLKLPELPASLRYRFVGRNLLLLDRESRLIIDFMPQALP